MGESLEKFYIPLFNEDLTPLKLLRARERGSFVDVVFNKDILEFTCVVTKDIIFGLTDNNILTFYQKTSLMTLF